MSLLLLFRGETTTEPTKQLGGWNPKTIVYGGATPVVATLRFTTPPARPRPTIVAPVVELPLAPSVVTPDYVARPTATLTASAALSRRRVSGASATHTALQFGERVADADGQVWSWRDEENELLALGFLL